MKVLSYDVRDWGGGILEDCGNLVRRQNIIFVVVLNVCIYVYKLNDMK